MASAKRKRQRDLRLLEESASTLTTVSSELVAVDEAALRADGSTAVRIISPGWGSSGYYSPQVLEAAASEGVFPAGTQMFWDHPSMSERSDRPERSLRDLAAVTETAAVWQQDHPQGPGLYAQVKVFEAFRPLLAEMAPHIGVSIRAGAEIAAGEAEGRKGRIVQRLVEGVSIDFVTRPGRGGQVLAVLEAAGRTDLIEEARNVAEWMQSRIHLDFTTRADDMFGEGRLTKDERIALSNGIGAALDAFTQTVEDLAPQLLTRDLWDDPAAAPSTESQEGLDMAITQEERAAIAAEAASAVVTQLTEAGVIPKPGDGEEATEAATKLTEAEQRATRAEEALLVESARKHAAANEKLKGLPQVTQTRLIESLSNGAEATDGKLDTAKLDEAIKTAVDAEVKYLAEATGSPVRGAGDGDLTPEASEAAQAELEKAMGRFGLSETAAKTAAAGRR